MAAYIKNGGGATGSGTYRGVWSASQTWAVGDRVVGTNVISWRVMECTTAGAGGAGAEPTWNTTTGATTTDNAAVFTTRLPSTWANATVDLRRVAASDGAGERIYLADDHSETTAAALSFNIAGSSANPSHVACVDDTSGEPPTTLATTAYIATSGANAITVGNNNNVTYWYGLTFDSGLTSSSGTANISTNGPSLFDRCIFRMSTTGAAVLYAVGGSSYCYYKDCQFKFGGTGQSIGSSAGGAIGGRIIIDGGSVESGGSTPTDIFKNLSGGTQVDIRGFDFSALASTVNLTGSVSGNSNVRFLNCKLPASWSGLLNNGGITAGGSAEMINCDSGDTNYRYRKASVVGTIQDETTLVRTSPDGLNGTLDYSLKLVSGANAEFPILTLDSPVLKVWNDTVGSALTATVEILRDSATNLTNDEIWLEVQYQGTSGYPLSLFVSDAKADVLATAADQTTSSETWTTTGMSNPNEQKLSVTFTPQEAGWVIGVVKLAKASTTVYVCPDMTVA